MGWLRGTTVAMDTPILVDGSDLCLMIGADDPAVDRSPILP